MPLASIFISVITVLELEFGALSIERKDKAQGLVLRSWIDDQILPRFEGRILPIDTAVALRCAKLHVPDPRAERDALDRGDRAGSWHDNRNANVSADFEPTGVQIINPWS